MNNLFKIKKKRPFKRLNIVLLTLMLLLSGCEKKVGEDKSQNSLTTITNQETFCVDKNKHLFLNSYEDYKQYLSNPEPSYELLYQTVKENKRIPKKYKEMFNRIIELFETTKINPKNLGVFYENLKKEEINTDYIADKSSPTTVTAFFISDPKRPSINIDENLADFYTFLHEVIHSCYEAQILYEDKLIVITSGGIKETLLHDNLVEINLYGNCFVEAQAEYIAQYLYRSQKRLSLSAFSYNINTDIFEFWTKTLDIDINTLFSSSIKDFEKSLATLQMEEEEIDGILFKMDALLEINEDFYEEDIRYSIYNQYIQKIVERYVTLGLTSKEVYEKIGNALKESVIEKIHDLNDLEYRNQYLNFQKKLFNSIDFWISLVLMQYDMDISSIYYYIGHEFDIYYSLYGKDVNLNTGNYYLSYNWDDEAVKNSFILLYVEEEEIKMCSYIENADGTLSCYNYYGEIEGIMNGVKLKDLLEKNFISMENGSIQFNITIEEMIFLLKSQKQVSRNEEKNIVKASDKTLYLNEGYVVICNATTNANGEEIAYHIFNNQIYLLPENVKRIDSIEELIEKEILSITEDNKIFYDLEAIEDYLKEQKEGLLSKKVF